MKIHRQRVAAILLFVALATLLFVRGIVPAVSRIDSDFPNYFTAARIVADGGPAARLYDDSWFQEQMRGVGFGRPENGKFAPFPPPTALLLLPLARLDPLTALRVVTAVSILGLLGSIFLLSRILSWSLVNAAVFVLLSGAAVSNSLRFGQPYILVSAACILGYYAHLKGKPWWAGLCFGLFVPVKYFPVVILIYFAFRREWRVVSGGALATAAIALVSIAVLGWQIHEEFLSSVLGNHLVAHLSLQDPFTASFQSFDTLYRRLFVYDPAANPRPWLALPDLQVIALAVTKTTILVAAIATLIKLARDATVNAAAPSIGILGILVLLLAPATATYHFVLLWLPVGLLASYFFLERAPTRAWLILTLYALIGFFPYGKSVGFEGRGGLTVLAYPRLFLVLAMFSAAVYFVWNRTRPAPVALKVSP
jgi:hypothetical protein